jgi:competence protein ComEA
MLDKLSKIIGFTGTEIKIIFFIIITFILGFSYKTFILNKQKTPDKILDYSNLNVLLDNYGEKNLNADSLKSNDKKVDYKQEVLDFNTHNFNNIQKKVIPAEKSINLNTAGFSELTKLPGIGKKTADEIIKYRKSIKQFNNINELLNVKGIGSSKFEKIKKYIFID